MQKSNRKNAFYYIVAMAIQTSSTTAALAKPNTTPSEQTLLAKLAGIEQTTDRTKWRNLPMTTAAGLIKIYEAKNTPPYIKFRTLKVLSLFPSTQACDFLEKVATDHETIHPKKPKKMLIWIQRQAIYSLASCPISQAQKPLKKLQAHSNTVLRRSANRALQHLADRIRLTSSKTPIETPSDQPLKID